MFATLYVSFFHLCQLCSVFVDRLAGSCPTDLPWLGQTRTCTVSLSDYRIKVRIIIILIAATITISITIITTIIMALSSTFNVTISITIKIAVNITNITRGILLLLY